LATSALRLACISAIDGSTVSFFAPLTGFGFPHFAGFARHHSSISAFESRRAGAGSAVVLVSRERIASSGFWVTRVSAGLP
jgi:hypothetical protein